MIEEAEDSRAMHTSLGPMMAPGAAGGGAINEDEEGAKLEGVRSAVASFVAALLAQSLAPKPKTEDEAVVKKAEAATKAAARALLDPEEVKSWHLFFFLGLFCWFIFLPKFELSSRN